MFTGYEKPIAIASLYSKMERERLFQRPRQNRNPTEKFKFDCEKQS